VRDVELAQRDTAWATERHTRCDF